MPSRWKAKAEGESVTRDFLIAHSWNSLADGIDRGEGRYISLLVKSLMTVGRSVLEGEMGDGSR